jgi:hypothetical protein
MVKDAIINIITLLDGKVFETDYTIDKGPKSDDKENLNNALPHHKKWIEKNGYVCPLCGSENIGADADDSGEGWVVRPLWCEECESSWNIGFSITDMEFNHSEV